MVHILAQSFGHCPVSAHHACITAERIYCSPPTILYSGFYRHRHKLFRKFIAAVVVKVRSSHQNQLAVFDGIRLQTLWWRSRDLFHLLKHFHIIIGGALKWTFRVALRHDVPIAVAILFTLIVFLYFATSSGVSASPDSGLRCGLFHHFCHRFCPFL